MVQGLGFGATFSPKSFELYTVGQQMEPVAVQLGHLGWGALGSKREAKLHLHLLVL